MANNTINHKDMLSALPVELRNMILELVLEDCRLRAGHYRLHAMVPLTIQRYISAGESGVEYPPHPLFYVNRSIANATRRSWQSRFGNRLEVDPRLTHFPAGIFSGITHLSLTMEQAAQTLQARIPHLPRDYNNEDPPTAELVLVHGLAIQHLEIHWDVPLHFIPPGDPNLEEYPDRQTQNAFVRLQYFRRSFQVTIHFRAEFFRLYVSGTIVLRDHANNPDDFTFHYHEPLPPDSRGAFERQLREYGWDSMFFSTGMGPEQRHAVIEAHPDRDFAPLGWREFEYRVGPASVHHHHQQQNWYRPPHPTGRDIMETNLPPRRNAPRPWDVPGPHWCRQDSQDWDD